MGACRMMGKQEFNGLVPVSQSFIISWDMLPVPGVLLLNLLHLRLDRLYAALRLDLPHEERDQQDADDDHQADDRQHQVTPDAGPKIGDRMVCQMRRIQETGNPGQVMMNTRASFVALGSELIVG